MILTGSLTILSFFPTVSIPSVSYSFPRVQDHRTTLRSDVYIPTERDIQTIITSYKRRWLEVVSEQEYKIFIEQVLEARALIEHQNRTTSIQW